MSLKHLPGTCVLIAPLFLSLGINCATASTPSVQTFVEQVPAAPPPEQGYPLAAGSLTMQDVLKTYPRKTQRTSSALPAASGLMMSQGMKAALQKLDVAQTSPVAPRVQKAPQASAQALPPAETTEAPAITYKGEVIGDAEPMPTEAKIETVEAPAKIEEPVASAPDKGCKPYVQKWEKSCGDAGYPESFAGKISGETRMNCADGALRDFWVANTCAPPGSPAPQKAASVDTTGARVEGSCGPANEKPVLTAPALDLCASGAASSVTGDGPWTWTCAGDNGRAASCSASVRKVEAIAKAENDGGFFSSLVDFFSFTGSREETKKAPVEPAAQAVAAVAEPANPDNLCGSSAETMAYEVPSKDLCREGAASTVTGEGPWSWTCTGAGGKTSACQTMSFLSEESEPTPKADSLACGGASGQAVRKAPTVDLCEGGKASVVRGTNPWRWTCSQGKRKVSCATIKSVDGACGRANGTTVKAPPSKKLCRTGVASAVTGEGPWTWTCAGTNGGEQASCAANAAGKPKKEIGAPAPSASLSDAPTPSSIPEAAQVTTDEAPAKAPDMISDTNSLKPPAFNENAPAPPTLQQVADSSAARASGPLVLDSTVSTIVFSPGSSALDDSVLVTLDKLAALMGEHSDAHISLLGYAEKGTARTGTRRLSLNRALAVRGYLGSKGIAENRVDVRAEGTAPASGYPDRVDIKVNN